jgi:hypothetical protein
MKASTRSTAVKTKMLTICKGCRKHNKNGYQYCTACHDKYRCNRKANAATRAIGPAPAPKAPENFRENMMRILTAP